jgi:hypothetical protein
MRNGLTLIAAMLLLAAAQVTNAQAVFGGTWRPDPQRPDANEPPDDIELANGTYECRSCKPPYKIKADGTDQPISNNPRYDTLSVSVADAHTVLKRAKKAGMTVVASKTVIAADGKTKAEVQTVTGVGPHPVEFSMLSARVAAGSPGSHAASGKWRSVEGDLVNHEEDTSYEITADTLKMTDGMGRSFTAKLDGTDAPYRGDPRFTTVSLKRVDDRTIEETDKNGAQTVLIAHWSVDPDGKTMRVRFDDTHGHVQTQTGHKLAATGSR